MKFTRELGGREGGREGGRGKRRREGEVREGGSTERWKEEGWGEGWERRWEAGREGGREGGERGEKDALRMG